MGAAAELQRRTGLQDPDTFAVLVSEEGDRPHRLGLGLRDLGVVGVGRRQHDLVDQVLDAVDLIVAHCLVVREVEAEPVRADQRAGLLHVVTQHLPQGPVEKMGGGVIATGGVALRHVDGGGRLLADLDRAGADDRAVADEPGDCIGRVDDRGDAGGGADLAGVADLTTGLGVEGGAIEEYLHRRCVFRVDRDDSDHGGVADLRRAVAHEGRDPVELHDVAILPGLFLRSGGILAG